MTEELKLDDVFKAPIFPVARTEVVPATELEIAAAIVILKARSKHYGEPLEVKAHPFRPDVGWRQAALNFIRMNREDTEKGRPNQI